MSYSVVLNTPLASVCGDFSQNKRLHNSNKILKTEIRINKLCKSILWFKYTSAHIKSMKYNKESRYED